MVWDHVVGLGIVPDHFGLVPSSPAANVLGANPRRERHRYRGFADAVAGDGLAATVLKPVVVAEMASCIDAVKVSVNDGGPLRNRG